MHRHTIEYFLLGLSLPAQYLALFALGILQGSVITILAGFLVTVSRLNFYLALGVVISSDIASDILYYYLGKGYRTIASYSWSWPIRIKPAKLERIESFYQRYGVWAVVILKVTDGLAVPAIVVAGMSKMPLKRFLVISIISALIKGGLLFAIGYKLGTAYGGAVDFLQAATIALTLALVFVVVSLYFYRTVMMPKQR